MPFAASAATPAIVATGLAKAYGEVVALRGVSFEVRTGTVLGLLGPNGAGKTTAVKVLTTLLRADGGAASVLGFDVARQAHQVRACVGLAGQHAAVDESLSARENLRLVARLTHVEPDTAAARSELLLRQFDLADAADRLVRTYSGGMRRRLDLAAALVHEPPVLVLDEPTTGLDPQGRAQLWSVIDGLVADGTTVLLTTQYLEEADRLADRIVVIDHGSVIAEGTSAGLKAGLGATVIETAFRDADTAQRARDALFSIGPSTVNGHTLRIGVAEGPTAMLAAVRALDGAGLAPATMSVHEPTLDDVFLSLTGHMAAAPAEGHATEVTPGRRRRRRART